MKMPILNKHIALSAKVAIIGIVSIISLYIFTSGIFLEIDTNKINDWISSYGIWAPIIYILMHTLAPVFFIPALPLTIAAGVLFGPIYGIVYTSIGLTLGACGSFLISRYITSEFLDNRINHKTWNTINKNIDKFGWQSIIITRIFLLMPSIILNYVYGLTTIRFSHYALSSFFCMIIISIIFIPLSSSIPHLIQGNLPATFIIGISILIISQLIIFYIRKKYIVD